MCGVFGVVRFDGAPTETALDAMARALRHRGPDGEGRAACGPAHLGHVRLAVRDPEGGAQPMRSPDGRFTLVYNGDLWGADSLLDELALDWTFRTRSDTEVVLAALALRGVSGLASLDGMFALALWDAERESLLVARDALGCKPLVYAWQDDGAFWFASEAKALLAARVVRPRPKWDALVEWAVAPALSGVRALPLDGISVLPPGRAMRISRDGGADVLDLAPRLALGVERDAESRARTVRDALEGAIRDAARNDPPRAVGVFLSGGLDSTWLAATARQVAEVHAFTALHDAHARADEGASRIVVSDDAPFASLAASALGVRQVEVHLSTSTLADDLREVAVIDDAIPAWEQQITQHRLARRAAQDVKYVLVGDAADELFHGYHFCLEPAASRSPRAFLERFGGALRAEFLNRDMRADFAPLDLLPRHYADVVHRDGLDWERDPTEAAAALVRARWLPRLLANGDAHTMAFALEARVPFASRAVIASAMQIPAALGFRAGVEKSVLRAAAPDSVPAAIRARRKSALPKHLDAEPTLRAEATRLLAEPHEVVARVYDVPALRALAARHAALGEWEQSVLFQGIVLHHWASARGVTA